MVRSSRRSHSPSSADSDGEGADLRQTQGDGEGNWVVGMDCRSMNPYRFLRVQLPDVSRGLLRRWLAEGVARVNGEVCDSSRTLRTGDVLSLDASVQALPKDRRRQRLAEVLYEDDSLLAVAKPSGVATVPERQSRRESLLEILKRERQEPGLKLVHRLDKHASGVVVFARGREAKRELIEQFSQRRVTKDYLALVRGRFPEDPEALRDRLSPLAGRRPRMVVRPDSGKDSLTGVRRAFVFRDFSVVHARPVTGRTHQIRVQLQHRGFPLVGDEVYGGETALYLSRLKSGYRPSRGEAERPLLDRLALHAWRIRLRSPSGTEVEVVAPLPKDLRTTFKQLQKIGAVLGEDAFQAFLDRPLGPDEDPFAGCDLRLQDPSSSAAPSAVRPEAPGFEPPVQVDPGLPDESEDS